MFQPENIMGIVVTDKDGIIKSVSHRNGVLNSSLIGIKWYNAFSIPVEESYKARDEYPKVFNLFESEQKISVYPSYGEDGDISGFHILVEKTDNGENSTQFLNKMLCLGKIVPGIAHEISNPLTYVSGWLQMFLSETHDTDPKKKTYTILIEEFERMAWLVNSLLEFAKQAPPTKEVFDVNQVIEDVVIMVGYTMKNENIEIVKKLSFSELKVAGDSNKLKQVFLNLLQNSREAMSSGGMVYLNTDLDQDNSIIIQFKDTGCGIAEDHLNKVFLPSYSNKTSDNGAGLGLSVCKTILNEFGGTMDVDSKVGIGTVITITLPSCYSS